MRRHTPFFRCARLTSLSLLLIPSLAAAEPQVRVATLFGQPAAIEVKGVSGLLAEEPCLGFSFQKLQAQGFFRHARRINPLTIHYAYSMFPCSAKGTFRARGQIFRWWINPGGWGGVEDQRGNTVYFACDRDRECRPLFPSGVSEIPDDA